VYFENLIGWYETRNDRMSYHEWTALQKQNLMEAILRRERGFSLDDVYCSTGLNSERSGLQNTPKSN